MQALFPENDINFIRFKVKDISVIIPVYGVEAYIEECLRSVMAQEGIDGLNVECLVVDDCGTDHSMEIAGNVMESYDGPIEFRIITRETNGGLSAARNSGIRESRGEYVFFLDSDDFIAPHCLFVLWDEIKKHPGVDMVFGQTVCFPDEKVHSGYLNLKKCGALEYDNESERMRAVYLRLPETAWNRLIRAQWLKDNKLYFREGFLNEDTIWQLQAYPLVRSYAAVLDGEPTYLYRQRSGSIMETADARALSVRKADIIINASMNMPRWDRAYFRYLINYLLSVKFKHPGFDAVAGMEFFDDVLKRFRKYERITAIQRLILAYIRLNRPFMRVCVIEWLLGLMGGE